MSKLTKEQRDALPLSSFGYPEERLYPIVDASDVADAAALIGKAPEDQRERIKRRIISIAKRKGFPIPAAWKSDTADHHRGARFGLNEVEASTDEWVYRSGKIFEVGNFPDKQFAIDEAGIDAAIEAFEPCPIDLEHIPTPLSGKLGQVEVLWREGPNLFGEVAIPKWLDTVLAGNERKVSASWDRATKRLTGLALVNEPRIPDAALLSAFAAFAGTRHSAADMADIQAIHDLTTRQGAACRDNPPGPQEIGNPGRAGMPTVRENGPTLYSRSARGGAGGRSMGSSRNRFINWFHAGRDMRDAARDAGAQLEDEAEFAVVEDVAEAAAAEARAEELRKVEADRDAARKELEIARQETFKARAERLQGEAAAFADGLIAGSKIFPGEREGVIALYTQAGMDDAAHGTAAFGGSVGGSRIETLKATYSARPAHSLTREQLNPGEGNGIRLVPGTAPSTRKADFTQPTPEGEEPSPERLKYLVSLAGGIEKKEA